MSELSEFVISGPLMLAALLALAAGAVSFASPCCIPLVPGYLGYLAGLVGADTTSASGDDEPPTRSSRCRLAGAALLFVAGFTAVFMAAVFMAAVIVVLGLSDALLSNETVLQRLGGVVMIAMGLVFLGLVPALQRDIRIHRVPRGGVAAAPVMGAVYGLGWTPCLGPTLTGVIALAAGTEVGPATTRGVLLVLAYCIGLGLPFVLLAIGAGWAVRTATWLRRRTRAIQLTGGAMLIAVGLALVTGLWGLFINWLQGPIAGFTTPI